MKTRPVLAGHDTLKTATPDPPTLCRAALFAAGVAVWLFQACVTGPPKLAPVPDRVDSLDGFGSISVRGGEIAVKGRFAFVFQRPDFGRIEALDPFGRTISILLFGGGTAYMILPSKGVYWSGPEENLMDKFLGFGLRASEVSTLIGGRWEDRPPGDTVQGPAWSIEKDGQGRALKGSRDGFLFETAEFFQGTSVPRAIVFSGPKGSGRLRVLKIHFNTPRRGDPFGLAVLKALREKTWPEIEAYLRDED